MDSSQNTYKSDVTSLTDRLDESERFIFECGQKGLSDLVKWESREAEKITASVSILNQRKRKRTQMQDGWVQDTAIDWVYSEWQQWYSLWHVRATCDTDRIGAIQEL